MHTVKEDTTLVGVSELRNKLESILEAAKHHKVIIEKRNKPVAVIMSINRYNTIEELLDRIEDIELGKLARARDRSSSEKDYVSIQQAFRKIGF